MRNQSKTRVSYKETLTGSANQPLEYIHTNDALGAGYPDSDDDFYNKEEDKDYCPVICLTKEEKKTLRQKWRQSLIIKLWGRKVGYNFLQKIVQSMWKPRAFSDLVPLENDYFLVHFYSKENYEFARDQGPLIFREQNELADALSKRALVYERGARIFDRPPDWIQPLLIHNKNGYSENSENLE